MFGSTKLNASRNPFILNLTVENVLLARDAGSVTQLLCSLMNYFVSDLGPSPAQLGVAAAADDDAIFFFFGPIRIWCPIQLLCWNTASPRFHSHADIWGIIRSSEMRMLQLPGLFYVHAQHAPKPSSSTWLCLFSSVLPSCFYFTTYHRQILYSSCCPKRKSIPGSCSQVVRKQSMRWSVGWCSICSTLQPSPMVMSFGRWLKEWDHGLTKWAFSTRWPGLALGWGARSCCSIMPKEASWDDSPGRLFFGGVSGTFN